jgi:hypothetical protein
MPSKNTQETEEDRDDEEGYRPGDYPGDCQISTPPAGRTVFGEVGRLR